MLNQRKLVQALYAIPFVREGVLWLKNNSLPGLRGISVFEILRFIQQELSRNALITRANAISFSFFLSFFPSIILLFTVLAYLPYYKDYQKIIYNYIQDVLPGTAGRYLYDTIKDIITIKRSGLLSLTFVLTVFFASNGMMAMMRGFEKSYPEVFKRRIPILKRWIAIQLTFVLAILLIVSMITIILGNIIIEKVFDIIHLGSFISFFLLLLRWSVMIVLGYTSITILYRKGAALRQPIAWKNPGAALATGLTLLSSIAFSYYVDSFNTYNKVYGSIGTIIVLMLWIQMNILFLLIGFELNAAVVMTNFERQAKLNKKTEQLLIEDEL